MAVLTPTTSGNLTGTIYGACTILADATNQELTLTTSQQNSANTVLASATYDLVLVRFSIRSPGSPTNILTVYVRNVTTATNVQSLTVNVSDIDACSFGLQNSGWYGFKMPGTWTANGTDSYAVGLQLSDTSTTLSVLGSSTSNLCVGYRKTGTQAPVAGDTFILAPEYTAAATYTGGTITMDSTATTDYGTGTSNTRAMQIGKGWTVAWPISGGPATYILRLSGNLEIQSGGIWTRGTDDTNRVASDIVHQLQLDCTTGTTGQFGVYMRAGCTVLEYGDKGPGGARWVLMDADAAVSATTITTATQLSARSGDEIGVTATSYRGYAESEVRTLGSDPGTTSVAITAGLTNAHEGGGAHTKIRGAVAALTRNVTTQATNASFPTIVSAGWTTGYPVLNVQLDEVAFRYGPTSSFVALNPGCTTVNCVFRDSMGAGLNVSQADVTTYPVIWNCCTNVSGTTTGFVVNSATATFPLVALPIAFRGCVSGFGTAVVTNGRFCGGNYGIVGTSSATPTYTDCAVHSANNAGIYFSQTNVLQYGWRATNCDLWRNGFYGIQVTNGVHVLDAVFQNVWMVGMGTYGIYLIGGGTGYATMNGAIFRDCTIAGDNLNTPQYAIQSQFGGQAELRFEGGSVGVADGFLQACSAQDTVGYVKIVSVGTRWGNPDFTTWTGYTTIASSTPAFYFRALKYGTAGDSHKFEGRAGSITVETTTVDVTPAIRLTPRTTLFKLESNGGVRGFGLTAGVTSGGTKTFSYKVYIQAAYNGAAPRLILKKNDAVGITADTVLDTHSGTTGAFETLSGTSPAVTADGVLEVVVDCDGTAGYIIVDTGAVT